MVDEMDTSSPDVISITCIDSSCLLTIAARAPALMLTCRRFYYETLPSTPNHRAFVDISRKGSKLVISPEKSPRRTIHSVHCARAMTKVVSCHDMDGLGLGYYHGWMLNNKLWPRKLEMLHDTLEKLLLGYIGDTPHHARDEPTTEIEFLWTLVKERCTMSIMFEHQDRMWLHDDDMIDAYGDGESFVNISAIASTDLLHDLLSRKPAVRAPIFTAKGVHKTFECNGLWKKIRILRILDDDRRESHCIGEFYWSPMGR